jgi:hypothetical protein
MAVERSSSASTPPMPRISAENLTVWRASIDLIVEN